MNDEPEVPIQTQASIDTIGAIAYAEGLGEGLAAFWRAMLDGGLPPDMARAAFLARMGYIFDAGDAYEAVTDDEEEDDEEEDDEA